MKYSEIKDLYEELDKLSLLDDKKEVTINIINENVDFEVEKYRFIYENDIDEIQQKEMKDDPEILGSFKDWFIADHSNLSYDIVKALKEGNKHEALGQHLIDNGCVEEMQEEYARLYGYGHHFAHYDHHTHEINTPNGMYYAFRTD